MKRGTIRALVASLAVVVAVSCGVVLGGCSSANPEQAIRDDLTATLDEVKNVDDATIEELMGSVDTSQLESYGIDGTEFARSLLDGFDYSIGDITVDGDTATAQVSITCKSAMDLYDELENMMTELSEDPDILSLLSDEGAFNARLGELLMEAMDSLEPSTKDLELTYTNADGTWTMDSSSAAELGQIFATA